MIKIITDSTAYITEKYLKEHDIKVIPLRVLFENEEFEEGLPGTFEPFFEKFEKSKSFPKTSQPSLLEFIDAYNKVIDDGNEAIVFTISSVLSGTNSVANLAKDQCKDPKKITVIDSKNACQTTWGFIMETVDMINQGKSRDEIASELERLQENSAICFVPDTLEYLKRGGRIGKVSATIGSLFQIKPILMFKKGNLGCEKRTLGIAKAISDLIAMIPQNIKRLFLVHISNSKFFEVLKEKIKGKFNVPTFEGEVGPVVASHIGPAIGVAWTC